MPTGKACLVARPRLAGARVADAAARAYARTGMAWTGHEHEADEEPTVAEIVERPREPDGPERLASAIGNQAFGALVSRTEDGITPDGTVHPDVEATIARSRGGGTALDPRIRDRFGSGLGDPLSDVRVHTDARSDALARTVSARAFTSGADVFFASGEYRPGSSDGDRLIAHELTHVVQQRGAPTGGPMLVSDPGDALETEAEEISRELTG